MEERTDGKPSGAEHASPIVRFAVERRITMVMAVLGLMVLGWLSVRAPHGTDADDLAQEVMLAFLEGLPRVRRADRIGAFLMGIARRVLVRRRDDLRRAATVPLDVDVADGPPTADVPREELRRALATLA